MGRYKLYSYADVKKAEDRPRLIGRYDKLKNALKTLYALEDCAIPIHERLISLEDTASPNEMKDLEIYGDDPEVFYYWQNHIVDGKLEAHKTLITYEKYLTMYP